MTTHENGAIETQPSEVARRDVMCPCDSGCDLCRTPEATGYGTYPPPNAVLGEN